MAGSKWGFAALLTGFLALGGCSGGGGGGGGGGDGDGDGGPDGRPPASFIGQWSGHYQDTATGKQHGFLLSITSESARDGTGVQMLSGIIQPLGLDGLPVAMVAGTRRGARADLASPPGPWNLSFFFVAGSMLAEGEFRFEQTFGPRQLLEGSLDSQLLAGNERMLGTWRGTWRSVVRPPSMGTIEWIITSVIPNPQPNGSMPELLVGRVRLEGFPEIEPIVFGLQTVGSVEVDRIEGVDVTFPDHAYRIDGFVHFGLLEGEYELRHVSPDVVVDRGTFQAELVP